jgi:putative copper export protein
VGGQVVLAGLVGTVRRISEEAPRTVARAFARLSWPAFAVLVVTGIWNMTAVHPSQRSTAWQVVLGVKIAVVALSGLAAYLHGRAGSRRRLALWGSVSGTAAVGSLVLGVLMAG